MKRPNLSTQLFIAVLATALGVALAMGWATHRSFEQRFIGYLNEQAVLRMEAVLPRFQQAWAEQGHWGYLRGRADLWFNLVGVGPRRPPPSDGSVPQLSASERELLATDLLGAGRRIGLLDAQRQHVVGFPLILAGSVEREIVVQGQTVGWLTIAPVQTFTDEAALRLQRGLLHASLATGAVALLLAALIAWWLSRSLLAPVRAVAQATHRLAAGEHDTRVPVQGQGEVAQLAQDFNALAQALARTQQQRRAYMADVSHELRTPLAVLRGGLEALEDGVHAPTPENLRALQAEVGQLTQLVNDLHELALADVGALRYHPTDIDLGPLLTRQLSALAQACQDKGLALEHQLTESGLWVHADAARLQQLLHNLLGNTVRHTDRGGQVRLLLRADGTHALLQIDDSAPGVPADQLPLLFERFFRADASRNRASGGSGLGLAICRSIVLAHGGSIEAGPSPWGGVCMRVRLPLKPPAVA